MKAVQKGYLQDLLTHIDKIIRYTKDGRDAFFASEMTQDAVLRNFTVLGEIVKRLGKEFTDNYPHIPWRNIAGFRDVITHDYEDIELYQVWHTVDTEIHPLRQAINEILAKFDDITG
jgi:uncharacterized protein with HEPN domain